MTRDPFTAVRRALDGTVLEGAALLIREDGHLQIGFPDVAELARPRGWRTGGLDALLEEAADARFGGIFGLERGAFVVAGAYKSPDAWRWDLVYEATANRASALHDDPTDPPAFQW